MWGLENYRQLILDEPNFWQVWRNTAVFVAAITAGSFAAGFTLALTLRGVRRCRGLLRTLFLLPYVMPTIVLSLLWLWMFNSTFGIVNYLLDAVWADRRIPAVVLRCHLGLSAGGAPVCMEGGRVPDDHDYGWAQPGALQPVRRGQR